MPADAPRGICPSCLLSTGLGLGVDASVPMVSVKEVDLGDRYVLGELLGEGGFGTVYKAEQIEPLRREVAVKILKPEMASGQVLARFEAERQALALMDHPNIARILDAGETRDGCPFFVMELVEGEPINSHCDRAGLDLEGRVELLLRVAEAVAHAHQKGVIHRDLKSSNILVTNAGDPKVIDFGVAKALAEPLTDRPLYTRVHQAIGTPAYMSPEQCGGATGSVDTRSDVFALGAVLYELLSGAPPLTSEALEKLSYVEMLDQIRNEELPPPSTRNNSIPQELDWICAKATAREPQRRYGGAAQFARELERFSRNETLVAGPPSKLYALKKFVRRNRAACAFGALALVALLAGLTASLALYLRAEGALEEVEQGRDALEESYVQRDLNDGINALATGRSSDAVAYLVDVLRTDPDNEVATTSLLNLLLHHRWVRPLHAPSLLPDNASKVLDLVVDAEQQRGLVLCEGGLMIVDQSGESYRCAKFDQNEAKAEIAHVSGSELVFLAGERTLKAIRLDGRSVKFSPRAFESPIVYWDLIDDQRKPALLVSTEDGKLWICDESGTREHETDEHRDEIKLVVAGEFNDGNFAYNKGGAIFSGQRLTPVAKELGAVQAMKILKPGRFVAVAHGGEGSVFPLQPSPRVRAIRSLKGMYDVTSNFDFLPDGKVLLAGCEDGRPRLWKLDFASGSADPLAEIGRHRAAVAAVKFTRDGRSGISVSVDGIGRVWDIASGNSEPLRSGGRLDRFAIDKLARLAISADVAKRTVTLWGIGRNPAICPRVDCLPLDDSMPEAALGFEIDGDRVSLKELATPIRATGKITAAAVSPDGSRLVTCVDGRTLQLWRCADGMELCMRWTGDVGVSAVSFYGENTLRLEIPMARKKLARLVPLPPSDARLDSAFLDFAEAFACRKSSGSGVITNLSVRSLADLPRSNIVGRVGQDYASWLVTQGGERPLSPGSQFTEASYVEGLKAFGTSGSLREAVRLESGKGDALGLLKRLREGDEIDLDSL